MSPTLVFAALVSMAAQAPAEPPPAAPTTEPTASPAGDAPAAEAPPPAAEAPPPAPPPKAEEPAPAKDEKPAPPKDEKLALVVGDLRFAPRAQLRVRAEYIGDRTLNAGYPATILHHRARGGFDAEWKDTAKLVFELHDTRGWGAEVTAAPPAPQDVSLFGKVANSVDLHQGYVGLYVGGSEVRVGRQEIVFANERVLGAVDWSMTGRSFDAIRLTNKAPGDFGYSAFCAMVRDVDHVPTATTPGLALCAAGVEHKLMPALRYAPLVMVELTDNDTLLSRATFGARVDGAVSGFSYDVDLFGQTSWVGRDVKLAYLAGARAAYEVDTMMHPKVGGMVDYVSGGDPATADVVTFDTGWGTNHKFYGFQDLFTNLPVHTLNRGLLDAAATLAVKEGPFSAQLAVHAFAPTAYQGGGSAFYGIEPDLVARYALTSNLAFDLGGALFVPVGDALGRGTNATPWMFAAVDVKL